MFEVKFADIGEGIHEGILYKWSVEKGEKVKEGQTLYLIETDKVTAEIPSPIDGEVHLLKFEVGDKINVGDTVLVIDDGSGEEKAVLDVVEEKGSSVVGEIEVSSKVIKSATEESRSSEERKRTLATPVARKMAKDLGVDINLVTGSGPSGRVMKEDINNYYEKRNLKSENYKKDINISQYKDNETVLEFTEIRRTIARHMADSKKNIPHAGVFDEIDVSELKKFRENTGSIEEEYGVKLTYLPYIIKAIVAAIKKNPIVNSQIDMEKEIIILKNDINIGIAVDTEKGLIVPVVKDAGKKSIIEIAMDINGLIEKTKEGTLNLNDISEGTFSVTNYGSIGSSFGMPIIKYPEAAILGIGRIELKARVVDGEIVARSVLPISMAFDHRIMDGGDAGRFLKEIKELLENPSKLFIN